MSKCLKVNKGTIWGSFSAQVERIFVTGATENEMVTKLGKEK